MAVDDGRGDVIVAVIALIISIGIAVGYAVWLFR